MQASNCVKQCHVKKASQLRIGHVRYISNVAPRLSGQNSKSLKHILSVGFCRGSRVKYRWSRVESRAVEGKMSRSRVISKGSR